MVYLLEDLAKLHDDRHVMDTCTETYEYVQTRGMCHAVKQSNSEYINKVVSELYSGFGTHSRAYVWGDDVADVGKDLFTNAFLNAVEWGNELNPGKTVSVKFEYSVFGGIMHVKDEGTGFDYESKIENLDDVGTGLKMFNDSKLYVSFHDDGSLVTIATDIFTMEDYRQFQKTAYATLN